MKHLFWVLLLPFLSHAQGTFAPLNDDYYQKIDRYEVKAGKVFQEIHTSSKPYQRDDIVAFMDSLEREGRFESKVDQYNYRYVLQDNHEWAKDSSVDAKRPVLKYFYRKKPDFYNVDVPGFDLHVNPVMYIGAGKDSRRDDMLFINSRGVEIRGMVDKKVGFYSYLTDNQAILPQYVEDYRRPYSILPHEGFWKGFKSNGVDYLQARGYISFAASRHIDLSFGHDRFFVGQGYRSLAFSDFAPPMMFLKGTVKVWKINYTTSIHRMVANPRGSVWGTGAQTKGYQYKYIAFHHLSTNIGKKLNVGLFESVVFSPNDTTGNGEFEMSYLNPIIFYRAIEHQNGSSDNVLLGLDFKWNALKRVSLYGQVILDEFLLDHLKKGDGWWANKFGIQGGLKYVDVLGISNLDLQWEANVVRPYTYSHHTVFGNYTNYSQPFAHPLGANFKEMLGIVRYQPLPRLNLTAKLIMATVGRDPVGENWGGDISKGNQTRQQEFGNTIGQGDKNQLMFGSLTASWMLAHNLVVDLQWVYRNSSGPATTVPIQLYNNTSSISSLSLRWNVPQRLYEF